MVKRTFIRPASKRVKRAKRTMNISRPRWSSSIRRAVPVISVKRTCYLGTIAPNTNTTPGFWQYRSVSLNSGFTNETNTNMGGLSNVAEYQALFDQFKLCAFKITLRPRANDLQYDQTGAALVRDIPYVSIVKDPVDAVIPAGIYSSSNLNSFLESGNVRTYRADKPVTIYMKPKVQEQFGSGAIRYVTPKWTTLDSTGINMPHRGFGCFFHNQSMTGIFNTHDVFITYYLKFKGMR